SSDIAVDPGDGGALQYFAQVSAAYASTRAPESAEDFEILEGFDLVENDTPCGGLCDSKSVCLSDQNICAPTARLCTPLCEGDTSCVTVDDQTQCLPTKNGRAGMFVVPFGVGLFASSASDDE